MSGNGHDDVPNKSILSEIQQVSVHGAGGTNLCRAKATNQYEFVAFLDFRKEEKEDKLTTESLILAQDER